MQLVGRFFDDPLLMRAGLRLPARDRLEQDHRRPRLTRERVATNSSISALTLSGISWAGSDLRRKVSHTVNRARPSWISFSYSGGLVDRPRRAAGAAWA